VVDENRELFESCPDVATLEALLRRMNLVDKLVNYAEKQGVKRRNLMIRTSRELIERYLFINIIDNVFGVKEATQYENRTDAAMLKALEIIHEGKARPELPSAPMKSE
jgi:carboxyl-terminal processing protease